MSRGRRLLTGTVLAMASAACDGTQPIPATWEHDLLIEARQASGPPELLLLPTGAAATRLFPSGMQASDPVPSPDGRRIAFVVANYAQSTGDIWVAGSQRRQRRSPDDGPGAR